MDEAVVVGWDTFPSFFCNFKDFVTASQAIVEQHVLLEEDMLDTSRGDNWTSEEDMPDTSRGDNVDVRTCMIDTRGDTGRQRRTDK